jgi:dienelactone hydrolase
MGASVGGGDALEAAGLVPGVAAAVAVSPDGNDSFLDPNTDARKDALPTLLAVAPGDPLAPVATVEHLYAEVPGHPKKLVILAANVGMHGWTLLGPSSPFALAATAWMLHPST